LRPSSLTFSRFAELTHIVPICIRVLSPFSVLGARETTAWTPDYQPKSERHRARLP